MKQAFWQARWGASQIGFHQDEPNSALRRFWGDLELDAATPVLVPLCGKSTDLLFLRGLGHPVVGVEFVHRAVEEFFAENHIPFGRQPEGAATVFTASDSGPPLRLICADILDLDPVLVGPIGAFYDRAALVALPPQTRPAYAAAIGAMIDQAGCGLLLSFEYPQTQRDGPPFSVEAPLVERLFGGRFSLHCCERTVLPAEDVARFEVSTCAEAVYLLRAH